MFAFGRDLKRKQGQVPAHVVDAFAHKPLDRENRVLRIRDHLFFREVSDHDISGVIEGDDRWNESRSIGRGNDARHTILDDGDKAVRGS